MHAESARTSILTAAPAALGKRDAEQHSFHAIAGQTASGLVWTGVAMVVAFLLKVLLTRKMLPRDMGIVLAAQSLTGLVLAVATLGVPDAVVRFLGIEATRISAPARTVALAIKIVGAASAAAAGLVLAAVFAWGTGTVAADALWATVIVTLALPLLALGDVVGAAYRGVNRLGTKIFLIDVGRPGLLAAALLLSPLALTRHAPYVAALYTGAALVTLAAAWLFFRSDSRWQAGGATTSRELLRFGIPMAGGALLAGPIINNILPLMLSAWTGTAAVAFYAVALSLHSFVYLPVSILEQALIPTWAQWVAHKRSDELLASYRRYSSISFAAATGVGLAIIANDTTILTLLFGPTFEAASGALRGAILATLCSALIGPSEGMLYALGLTGSIFNARLAAAIAGVAAGALLIPAFGLPGAVGAFAVAIVACNSLYGVIVYRASGIHPFTPQFAITVVIATAGVLAATGLQDAYPMARTIVVSAFAVIVVAANVDIRIAVRQVLSTP